MKFKLNAGAELDLLTKDEVTDALAAAQTAWVTELARGDRYRRIQGAATITATALALGGDQDRDGNLGPAAGFVWSVRRLAIVAGTAADILLLKLSVNDDMAGSVVRPVCAASMQFHQAELVLYPGDKLLLTSTAALAGAGTVTLAGQVRELPISSAWRL